MSLTIVPKFAKGQQVVTRFGKKVKIESVEVDVIISYVASGETYGEDELSVSRVVGCTHRGPDGSHYGVSSPPDEMNYEFIFCPLCGVRLKSSSTNNGII